MTVEFDIVVSGTFHPQRFNGFRGLLVDGKTVREVDDLVFRAVYHEDRGCDLLGLLDAEIKEISTVKYEWRKKNDEELFGSE